MKRRNFLGFMTGAVVSGPKIAKAAGEMKIGDLNLANNTDNAIGGDAWQRETPMPTSSQLMNDISYAKKCLKEFLGKTASQMAREKREIYINALDPDISGLRSISLRSKMEMQRTLLYDRKRRNIEEHLRERIANKIKDTLL